MIASDNRRLAGRPDITMVGIAWQFWNTGEWGISIPKFSGSGIMGASYPLHLKRGI